MAATRVFRLSPGPNSRLRRTTHRGRSFRRRSFGDLIAQPVCVEECPDTAGAGTRQEHALHCRPGPLLLQVSRQLQPSYCGQRKSIPSCRGGIRLLPRCVSEEQYGTYTTLAS